ncbi:hypothetical protein R3P38DRAFT_2908440 [Favolaschia claudopus]|uniref:Uncharacterized protein n=1 Tax=Favolaschia claudopus TaxID=2862362 RepID=A0AAW0CAD5_9AGAR
MGSLPVSDAKYDLSLLAQVPPPTKAQRQEGYDHLILIQPNRRATRAEYDSEKVKVDLAKEDENCGLSSPTEAKIAAERLPQQQQQPLPQQSWFHGWRKAIVLVFVVLVVLAAIIVGTVEGIASQSRKHASSPAESTSDSNPDPSSDSEPIGSVDPSAASIAPVSNASASAAQEEFGTVAVAVATQSAELPDRFVKNAARSLHKARRHRRASSRKTFLD